MSYLLKVIKYKYDYERTVTLVGKDRKVETLIFKGSDISSTTVRVVEGSMFEQTRSAKQQFVFNLLQSGVLNPEQDKLLILEMLELGAIDKLYDTYSVDLKKAEKEESNWTLGNFNTPVRDFQKHEVHIDCHNKWRNSEDYENLPPEIMAIIDDHVMQHQMFLQPPVDAEPEQRNISGEKTAVNEMIDGLSDEEQQFISDNPDVLDEYYNS
jgi:hypothetical protein